MPLPYVFTILNEWRSYAVYVLLHFSYFITCYFVQCTSYKYMHLKDGRMKESKFPLPCLTNDDIIIIEMVKRKDGKWSKGRRKANDIDVSLTLIMWYNFPRDIITKYTLFIYIQHSSFARFTWTSRLKLLFNNNNYFFFSNVQNVKNKKFLALNHHRLMTSSSSYYIMNTHHRSSFIYLFENVFVARFFDC